jgi:hypothetical protein
VLLDSQQDFIRWEELVGAQMAIWLAQKVKMDIERSSDFFKLGDSPNMDRLALQIDLFTRAYY